MRKYAAAAIAILLLTAPLMAASQQDWDQCSGSDPAQAIDACSRVLSDQDLSKQDRTDAYVYRAGAYLAQGINDQAIVDYTEALRISPQNVVAYVSRAIADYRKGDRVQAASDYAAANRIDASKVAQIASTNSEVREIAAIASAPTHAPPSLPAAQNGPPPPTVPQTVPTPPPPPAPATASKTAPPPIPFTKRAANVTCTTWCPNSPNSTYCPGIHWCCPVDNFYCPGNPTATKCVPRSNPNACQGTQMLSCCTGPTDCAKGC
jgi:hypothetical protein